LITLAPTNRYDGHEFKPNPHQIEWATKYHEILNEMGQSELFIKFRNKLRNEKTSKLEKFHIFLF